jgi:membrane-bound serine protease (ClpP class)
LTLVSLQASYPGIHLGAQRKVVLVVRLETAITGATAMMMEDAMEVADSMGASLLVVEANTPGGEINAVKRIMDLFETSAIPICFYVHPPGAVAWSGGTYLLVASHIAAMASGTSIGSAQPVLATGEPINDSKRINALSALMMNHAQIHDRNRTAARLFVTENLNLRPEEALSSGVVEIVADNIPSLLMRISGMTLLKVETDIGARVWKLAPRGEAGGYATISRIPFSGLDEAEVVEYSPGLQMGALEVLFNPLVSSLMFTFGFFLLFIGLQTPGLGAEFVGGVLLILSLMAYQVIGIGPTMVVFFVLGFGLLVAELKTNIGFLGLAGAACIVLGSFLLIPSPNWLLAPEVAIRIRNLLVGTSAALSAFFGFLVYKVAKTRGLRVSTGAESIEGATGIAVTWLDPVGEVRVQGEFWRAKAADGPIDRGSTVKVDGREGLLLVVRATESPETHAGLKKRER